MTLTEIQLLGAAALILIPLELLIPLHPSKATLRPGLGVDVLHVVVSGFLIRIGLAVTTLGLGYAFSTVVPDTWGEAIRRQAGFVQFVQLFVLADLCFYLAHRLVHAVPWLWRFHAVHHSSEQLDWLSTFRVHPVDQILNGTIIAWPAVALGFSPVAVGAYAVVYRLHALLLHSNVGLPFGVLGRAFASPHYHHWHHADEPGVPNCNFGGQLVIWDRLCGTLHDPTTLPRRYGVGGTVPNHYARQLVAPFVPIGRVQSVPDPADKVSYQPSLNPGSTRSTETARFLSAGSRKASHRVAAGG